MKHRKEWIIYSVIMVAVLLGSVWANSGRRPPRIATGIVETDLVVKDLACYGTADNEQIAVGSIINQSNEPIEDVLVAVLTYEHNGRFYGSGSQVIGSFVPQQSKVFSMRMFRSDAVLIGRCSIKLFDGDDNLLVEPER